MAMTVQCTVLFVAALIGWDREVGVLREMLVAPVHLARFALHQSVALVSAGHHDRDRAPTGGIGRARTIPIDRPALGHGQPGRG
ncbi:MAG: hypothetical protein ACYCV5_07800 [Acidimicrobiales bacterium]